MPYYFFFGILVTVFTGLKNCYMFNIHAAMTCSVL